MTSIYNHWLVALSVIVAMLVSYTALRLAARVAANEGHGAWVWLGIGATAMGIGIWSMHFIGMLAFSLPIPLAYDIPTTLASLAVAIVTSVFALAMTRGQRLSVVRLGASAVAMGAGISTMHYMGMAAIAIVPAISYDPLLVATSILIAVSASFVALWLLFRLREGRSFRQRLTRIAAAVVMGLGISGMHFTAMAASRFALGSFCRGGVILQNGWIGASIGIFALGILAVTLATAIYDVHLQSTARIQAMRLAQANADLLGANSDLLQSREMFRLMAESTNAIPFTLDLTRSCFPYIGAKGIADSGIAESVWKEPGALEVIFPRNANREVRQHFDECQCGRFEFVTTLSQRTDRHTEVRWTGTCEIVSGTKFMRGLMLDITELRRLSRDLVASQKLESVGRLAAGVAHEINTPAQFVSDNVQFLRASMTDIAAVIHTYRNLQHAIRSGGDVAAAIQHAVDAEKAADLDFITEQIPLALDSSLEGLRRIATIVRSMKEFAHPDQAQKAQADLNQAIRSTLVIAQNEYKFVAEMEVEFGALPPVPCYLGEINQVVLNLLMNASHAISDVVKDTGRLGKITVRTRLYANEIEISIQDTGIGIPEAARDKIFDPFFTTKAVGRGTGQGLAIARRVIVNKHGGKLYFETECGTGTTFFIRLPINDGDSETQVAA
jgi:NO-binding membrane sensor protein with MHYT domain/nitrogen-specific signal transduction histidine kinase